MNGSLDLTSLEAASGLRLRVIGAVNHRHIAGIIRLIRYTLDEVCIHQTHFVAGVQSLVLRNRLCHEVLAFDPELTREGDGTASKCLVFQVVRCREFLALSFRIVVDHKL